MRAILISFFIILQTVGALAQVTRDEMRAFAYAGDVDALEAAMEEAHAQSLQGCEEAIDHARDLVLALTTSHPMILRTTDAWLEAYPNSPYANTLRAFQYRRVAWNMRGPGAASQIPPDALASFRDLHIEAMDHAAKAYETAPDFIPASDAVFRLQTVTKRFPRAFILGMIAVVMDENPNLGSLIRAADFAKKGWGAGTQQDIILLCEEHAHKVPDTTYDADICIAHLTYSYTWSQTNMAYAWERLGDKDHEILAWVLAHNATISVQRFRTEEERNIVEGYLRDQGSADYEMADRYLAGYDARREDTKALATEVANNAAAKAREDIEHDPYNPELIRVLQGYAPIYNGVDHDYKLHHNHPVRRILAARMAVARPFHPRSWSNAARAQPSDVESILAGIADPYYANAIYYSNHYRGALEGLVIHKMTGLRPTYRAKWFGDGSPVVFSEAEVDAICMIVRLDRLFDHSCRSDGLGPERCPTLATLNPEYRMVVEDARNENICQAERSASIAELKFTDTPVNLDELSLPLVFD